MKLTIVRGPSGSGKTTLANKLAQETGAVVVSADNFFEIEDEYKFSFSYLSVAHAYCLGMVGYHLFRGKDVIVANTFSQKWEIEKYVELAHNNKIKWDIVEPTTKWKNDATTLAKKNVHNVPEFAIQKMLDRYEKTSDILKAFEKYEVS